MGAVVSDLTALARIRNAALDGFAADGVAATSIRDVAKRAGVSPGLVQHYFASKSALVQAVNEYVIQIAAEAFRDLPESGSAVDVQQQLGDTVTASVRKHPTALLYVARCSADGEPAALQIFDAFVAIVQEHWQRLAEEGLLRPDIDLTWSALQGVVLVLGTVLFNAAINRHLPAPYFTPEQLERWNSANNALFREGAYRTKAVAPADGARQPKQTDTTP
jgi:TetR/AcrR family transcriptional regulator, regulator of cefoperazone and chloramphenicol sensitivity